MRDGLLRNLKSVFAGKESVVVTDAAQLADWLAADGVPTLTFDELMTGSADVPRQALIVPLDYGRVPSRPALREKLSATSALWLPLASFSSDLETAKYAVRMFAEMDMAQSVAMNRRIAARLLMAREEVTLSGPDTALRMRLPDALQISGRTRVALLPDEHSTLGNYFEMAISPTDMSGRIDAALSVSGTFRIDSVLVAKHREIKGERAASFPAAVEIADGLRRACPLQVTIRDSRIVDGLGDWAESIDTLSGPEYRGALTEVAVGTGAMPLDSVNWDLNCVLNEGATGIHIGVGNGLNGMHFDFISTEARLDGL